jgi:MoaA/NifB/PqqE/SkfB family radical SAM enzyme
MEYSIGKYPDQSISEIWNSEAAKKVRQDMREYKLYEGCRICKADIDSGAFAEVRARHFDSLPQHHSYPTMMEFLLTNTCNLECIMCSGEYSSLIRQNRENLPPIEKLYDNSFIEQLSEFIPYLHEARFSGSGEAFLIEDNFRIWEMIIKLNPKCVIMVQTNGMVLNSRIKDFLKRGNFQIGVSLDSLKKDVYETIRPHAKYERVIENIQYFSEYCKSKKQKFVLAMCVMRQNYTELADFVRFANSMSATANFHKVYYPIEHSLRTLSKKELEVVVDHLSTLQLEENTQLEKMNKRHYQYIVDSVQEWLRQVTFNLFEEISDEALLAGILDNFGTFLRKDLALGENTDNELLFIKAKFNELLAMYTNPNQKRQILVHLYKADMPITYSFFKDLTLDKLFSLSEELLAHEEQLRNNAKN